MEDRGKLKEEFFQACEQEQFDAAYAIFCRLEKQLVYPILQPEKLSSEEIKALSVDEIDEYLSLLKPLLWSHFYRQEFERASVCCSVILTWMEFKPESAQLDQYRAELLKYLSRRVERFKAEKNTDELKRSFIKIDDLINTFYDIDVFRRTHPEIKQILIRRWIVVYEQPEYIRPFKFSGAVEKLQKIFKAACEKKSIKEALDASQRIAKELGMELFSPCKAIGHSEAEFRLIRELLLGLVGLYFAQANFSAFTEPERENMARTCFALIIFFDGEIFTQETFLQCARAHHLLSVVFHSRGDQEKMAAHHEEAEKQWALCHQTKKIESAVSEEAIDRAALRVSFVGLCARDKLEMVEILYPHLDKEQERRLLTPSIEAYLEMVKRFLTRCHASLKERNWDNFHAHCVQTERSIALLETGIANKELKPMGVRFLQLLKKAYSEYHDLPEYDKCKILLDFILRVYEKVPHTEHDKRELKIWKSKKDHVEKLTENLNKKDDAKNGASATAKQKKRAQRRKAAKERQIAEKVPEIPAMSEVLPHSFFQPPENSAISQEECKSVIGQSEKLLLELKSIEKNNFAILQKKMDIADVCEDLFKLNPAVQNIKDDETHELRRFMKFLYACWDTKYDTPDAELNFCGEDPAGYLKKACQLLLNETMHRGHSVRPSKKG